MPAPFKKIVIGISGASGSIYGIRLLEALRQDVSIETHLVISKSGQRTIIEETSWSIAEVEALADVVYPVADIGAAIASGSFKTLGMVITPCSVRTMSAIATGVTDNLLTRAADVMLKERRPLILMVRETPFHLGHLRNLTQLAEMGAIIAPPLPAFYPRPETVDDIVNHSIGRILDILGIENSLVTRWVGKVRNTEFV
ncbi:MAG: 3-octaprenyl-4-hydroxybenzoate carboxy-lyase [Rickettsiales bacterium]|jgi:4-hydroxy-3-polyprenylbenzoate decarboxylase|nr:3-octaprenyl-4-hydroxybenzoate carboxy-lyase [Rickettsiales bacterium]